MHRAVKRWQAWARGVRFWRMFTTQSLTTAQAARNASSLTWSLRVWRSRVSYTRALKRASTLVSTQVSPHWRVRRALRVWRGRAASGVGRERVEAMFQAYLRGKWLGACFDRWVGYMEGKGAWREKVREGARSLLLLKASKALSVWRAAATFTRTLHEALREKRVFALTHALRVWQKRARVAARRELAKRIGARRMLRVVWEAWVGWARQRGVDWGEGGRKRAAADNSTTLASWLTHRRMAGALHAWREIAGGVIRAHQHALRVAKGKLPGILAEWHRVAQEKAAWKGVCVRARVLLMASSARRALGAWRQELKASARARLVLHTVSVLLPRQVKRGVFTEWALWAFKNRALRARVAGLRAARLERSTAAAVGKWHWMGLARARRKRLIGGMVDAFEGARVRCIIKALARWAREVVVGRLGEEAADRHYIHTLAAKTFARWRVDVVLGRARRSGIASCLARMAMRKWARATLTPRHTFVHSPLPPPFPPPLPVTLSFGGGELGAGGEGGGKWRHFLGEDREEGRGGGEDGTSDIHLPSRRAFRLELRGFSRATGLKFF